MYLIRNIHSGAYFVRWLDSDPNPVWALRAAFPFCWDDFHMADRARKLLPFPDQAEVISE